MKMRKMKKNDNENIEKITNLGKELIKMIDKGKYPELTIPARNKANVIYDKKTGYLTLGTNVEKRVYNNISQTKKFLQTVAVLDKLKHFMSEKKTTSIRGLFYQLKYSLGEDLDEQLFDEQGESTNIASDAELMLGTRRERLNLNANERGSIIGNIIIKDKIGSRIEIIDLSKLGSAGWKVISDVDKIELKKVSAKYIIVVEKEVLWKRLNEDDFWKKENCIIATPGGQSSRGFRRLIHRLNSEFNIPVYVLTDSDPWGYYIYFTIKRGSMNLAWLNKDLATPDAKYIGMLSTDVKFYPFLKDMYIKSKDVDIKRLKDMSGYPWINSSKEWVDEMNNMLKEGKKMESDAVMAKDLSFICQYIKDKIKNKDFID